jgi:hypothetical protein
MAKPLHVSAFELFYNSSQNHLEALIAFGLFMDSEHKWASGQTTWPTEKKYADYHEIYLTPHEIDGYKESAQRVLQQFSNDVVAHEQTRMLAGALRQYKTAQKIIISWRYAASAVVIIVFCGISALLGIVAALAFSAETSSSSQLFVAGGAGILIVLIVTIAITQLETKKADEQT